MLQVATRQVRTWRRLLKQGRFHQAILGFIRLRRRAKLTRSHARTAVAVVQRKANNKERSSTS